MAIFFPVTLVHTAPVSLFPIITNHAAQTSDNDIQAITTSVDDHSRLKLFEVIVGLNADQTRSDNN